MCGLEVIDNGIIYDGKKMTVRSKRIGKGYVLNVDGKKIRVNSEQLVLMYTYFSVMYKQYSKEVAKEGGVYDRV